MMRYSRSLAFAVHDENVIPNPSNVIVALSIVRPFPVGMIKAEDLLREVHPASRRQRDHALLAHYIAAINIEATFHGVHGVTISP